MDLPRELVPARRDRRRQLRLATALLVAACLLVAVRPDPAFSAGTVTPSTNPAVPVIPGLPPIATPTQPVPSPLPKKSGTITLDVSKLSVKKSASITGLSTTAADAGATAAATSSVALRALVVAVDSNDFGVATWKSTLDRVGAQYDVLYTSTAPLTTDSLIRPDGTGRYNAILLTNSMLLYQDGTGAWVSGLSADEWNLLWAYERDYAVRQATLYSSYGTWPEDYCTRAGSEGGVGDTAITATLNTSGAQVLDYLKASAQIPILQSYVYRNRIEAGCNAQPILSAGSDVLGVLSTSTDGRERVALSFTSNQYLLQASLLTYGLFRWASHGMFLGEQRHFLSVDVDDWFNSTDEMSATGVLNVDPGFQMSGHDAYNAYLQQVALRSRYPLAAGWRMDLAFNGADAATNTNSTCYPNGGIGRLTATSRCLRNEFRWINHTYQHLKLNFTDYATTYADINNNLTAATRLGLPVDSTVLKTGEYSGLGVYHPDPNNDIDPPTDHGLMASNPNLLQAAKDLGVKYLHGNMSFPSHQPSCFNCAVTHPMEPSLSIVPDWPTNIAYFSTTPAEETYFYNSFYGPNGKFPYWPTNLTYNQIIEYETDQALGRVASGSVYTNTFHIGNLRDYGRGRTLTTDWADRLIAKYSSYYSVPLLNPGWPTIAKYAVARSAHFNTLAGVDVIYNRTTNTVTVTSSANGSVTLSGATITGATTYGTDMSGTVTLTANVPVTFPARLLP